MTQTAYLPETTTRLDAEDEAPSAVQLSRPTGGPPARPHAALPYSWTMLEYVREGLAIQEHLVFEAVQPLDDAELRALLSATHNRRCRDMVAGRRASPEALLVDRLLATVGAVVDC